MAYARLQFAAVQQEPIKNNNKDSEIDVTRVQNAKIQTIHMFTGFVCENRNFFKSCITSLTAITYL